MHPSQQDNDKKVWSLIANLNVISYSNWPFCLDAKLSNSNYRDPQLQVNKTVYIC